MKVKRHFGHPVRSIMLTASFSKHMGIRNLAEHLSRGVVLHRRLPAKFGRLPIYVTPEAGLLYWSAMSRIDSVLYSMAEEMVKPGAAVWDVGANVGLFSFCSAALAGPTGKVLAIEPDFWLAHLINRSPRREIQALRAQVRPHKCIERAWFHTFAIPTQA